MKVNIVHVCQESEVVQILWRALWGCGGGVLEQPMLRKGAS